jgi:hypothetical protein
MVSFIQALLPVLFYNYGRGRRLTSAAVLHRWSDGFKILITRPCIGFSADLFFRRAGSVSRSPTASRSTGCPVCSVRARCGRWGCS